MAEDLSTPLSIVAIGASAGGLEALQEFVKAVPAETGLSFVVVQHLSPDHPSIMDQLLAAHSAIPVRKISDGDPALRDTIHVIPAGPNLTLSNGRFRLHDDRDDYGVRTPIDRFFASVAEDAGMRSFGVVLSGTGSDGTAGIRAIKAAGGIAIVQESGSARFPGMPDSAAATGLVDFSMNPKRIPARLVDISLYRARLSNVDSRESLAADIEAELPRILGLLKSDSNGHDFAQYKPGTIVRRIERRMTILRKRNVSGFISLLKQNEQERTRLLQDFLIGVTQFFRDPEHFEDLRKHVIKPIVEKADEKIRVWVPGCATGEEAYTLAILFIEAIERQDRDVSIQIFGSDVDPSALFVARQGAYPAGTLRDLGDARLEKFFYPEDGSYRASPYLRECCVFAPHNLIDDPPFSRLDLISCRNLLIYLNASAQKQVIPKLHYALKPGGYLFLGPSESLGECEGMFEPVEKSARIFRRNNQVPQQYSTLALNAQKLSVQKGLRRIEFAATSVLTEPPELDFEDRVEAFFLKELAPPFAIVDRQNQVIYLSEQMAGFVKPAKGVPSSEFDAFLTEELRMPVRAAIAQARGEASYGQCTAVVQTPDGRQTGIVVDTRVFEAASGQIMICLRELEPVFPAGISDGDPTPDHAALEAREREIQRLRQQLNALLTDYESSNQKLRSSNEELLSMNEEMQSANEELETSREELQSFNEELETMNAELNENNMQVRQANSDLKNLFESTDIATMFLDNSLCVRRFTPRTASLFGVRERDIGRPLIDLARRFNLDSLMDDVERVRQSLQIVEHEVTVEATNETYILRIHPYRTLDDRLDGFVLNFFEITTRKRQKQQLQKNEESLRRQYSELETLYDTTPVGLALLDRECRWIRINERLAEINGYPVAEHIGKKQSELLPEVHARVASLMEKVFETGKPVLGLELHGKTPAEPDRTRDWIVDYYPVFAGDKVFAIGACVREVTDQKNLEHQLRIALGRIEAAVARHPIQFHEIDLDRQIVWAMSSHPALPGSALIGQPFDLRLDPQAESVFEAALDSALADGKSTRCDLALKHAGEQISFDLSVEPLRNERQMLVGALLVWFDISARKRDEERKSLLLAELQHRVKNTLATIVSIVRLTSRHESSVDSLAKNLSARLEAISRTHDQLTDNGWQSVSLRSLISQEMRAFLSEEHGGFHMLGQDAQLDPRQALAIGMAVHELATNSSKYGALADTGGRLEVTLSSGRIDGTCRLDWKETLTAELASPGDKAGFGRLLLTSILPRQIGGESELVFDADGVHFSIEFPCTPEEETNE